MDVVPVACLQDNYAYLLLDRGSGTALVVDPSEAEPVRAALAREGVRAVAGVLVTHHHWDHVGGLAEVCRAWPTAPVVAHDSELRTGRIEAQTRGVADGEHFALGPFAIEAMHVPGHTTGALAWAVGDALFTGDTLFRAGCGRLFEGTAATMYASLTRLAGSDATRAVYPGHEYTVKNLRFAQSILPDDAPVAAALAEAEAQRAAGRPTVGTPLALERRTNPFLRCDTAAVQQRLGTPGDPVATFAALRTRRDTY